MCRDARRIQQALNTTRLSLHKFPLCALIYKGSRHISVGVNRTRGHPLQINPYTGRRGRSTHAELDAILGVPTRDLEGATIYVARKLKNGERGTARPCKSCMTVILASGIKRMVFTTYEGHESEDI